QEEGGKKESEERQETQRHQDPAHAAPGRRQRIEPPTAPSISALTNRNLLSNPGIDAKKATPNFHGSGQFFCEEETECFIRLRSQIFHVEVRSQPDVVGQIPSRMIGVFVN